MSDRVMDEARLLRLFVPLYTRVVASPKGELERVYLSGLEEIADALGEDLDEVAAYAYELLQVVEASLWHCAACDGRELPGTTHCRRCGAALPIADVLPFRPRQPPDAGR